MTQETIDKRIAELQSEQTDLSTSHDRTVQQFQQIIQQNQNRFQQLKGAIDVLTDLKTQLNGDSYDQQDQQGGLRIPTPNPKSP